MPLVSVFMLTQALAMDVTDGLQTPRPPETPTDDVHEPVARILRACPLSALSDDSRPVVVRHLKGPNGGQRRVSLRSGLTVCGAGPPTKTGTWACLFVRRGGKIFAAPPGLLNSLWANVRRWARCLKINNSSGIEFSVHAPLANFMA